jgi:Cu2+-exporting ATPase
VRIHIRGAGRLYVTGVACGSLEAERLQTWLRAQTHVHHVEQRSATGVLHVAYTEPPRLPGHLLRALRERLSAWEHEAATPFDVRPIHSLPGRMRLRVNGLSARKLALTTVTARAVPGVERVQWLTDSSTILVRYDSRHVTESQIVEALRRSPPGEWISESQLPVRLRWGGALNATLVLGLCLTRALPFPALAVGVLTSMARPTHRTLNALLEGQASIDLLDVAAATAALAARLPATAAFVIWMVAIGDLLLDVSAGGARVAVSRLLGQREPMVARLRADGSTERVALDQLEEGDRFVAVTGRGIAADGRVLSGLAQVDERTLTGESSLIEKRTGDQVLASTVVVEGQLVVEVNRAGRNSEAAKIVRILNSVASKPLTLQRHALDIAGRLVLPTFCVAGLAAALTSEISRAICILITDFGTGIRVAVPTTALTGMQLAAREGVLFKGAQYLERLAKADLIVFDKTGILTTGEPEVVEVLTAHGFDEATVIGLSASAEMRLKHPLSRALASCAMRRAIPLVEPELGSEQYSVGLGLAARVAGHRVLVGRKEFMERHSLEIRPLAPALARLTEDRVSSLFCAVDDEMAGLIGYSDAVRPESSAIVERLRADGRRRVVILSGDGKGVVRKVARAVGIREARSSLLPHQKASFIEKMRAESHIVAMVGDGINDAPALALADVGISIAGSTDVAVETADVILLRDGLGQLARAFEISDETMAHVRQNLGLVIAPNAVAILLGALGLMTPPLAAVINNGATIAAVIVGTIPLLRRPRARQQTDKADGRRDEIPR